MQIIKQLKSIEFSYNYESKKFEITRDDGFSQYLDLNKVEAFALMRFIIRISQKNWMRPKKNLEDTSDTIIDRSEDEDQLTMFI